MFHDHKTKKKTWKSNEPTTHQEVKKSKKKTNKKKHTPNLKVNPEGRHLPTTAISSNLRSLGESRKRGRGEVQRRDANVSDRYTHSHTQTTGSGLLRFLRPAESGDYAPIRRPHLRQWATVEAHSVKKKNKIK